MHTQQNLKSFAFIWSGIFSFIGLIPLYKNNDIKIWALIIAIIFIITAVTKPTILQPFYIVWLKIGEFIGGIISKIMLSILFYLIFTPIAFFLRLLGKDILNKRIDKTASSYWISRERQPESMKNQF